MLAKQNVGQQLNAKTKILAFFRFFFYKHEFWAKKMASKYLSQKRFLFIFLVSELRESVSHMRNF